MQSEKCRSSHVGGAVRRLDLLPIAVGQLTIWRLTRRIREQARSHI